MRRVPSSSLRGVRAGRRLLAGGLMLVAGLVVAGASQAAGGLSDSDVISVMVDNAKVVRLPEQTATVVVGNPAIADVTSRPGGVAILTGKSLGTTNLIALDAKGTLITEASITVQAPMTSIVSVQRGAEGRNSYICAPRCQPAAVLGDSIPWFNEVSGQADRRSQLASGASIPLTAPGAPGSQAPAGR
ncbi:pilus assembly protein N-terminal domain-containing protein [Methylobacterium sp. C25]|uniref:pilus assembly protein N-terminal domain-containing protein n=1 Tax=Methylobacterium sp. C25 TaxID=2721622 RepID=UPI001F478FC7|nr:pilus assembly protein N-terminal domain-containing protein [Methylobacterium sp. C25]